MKLAPITVTWTPGGPDLEEEFTKWAGVPYMSGGSSTAGADCLGSVFSILGLPHDRIPADTCMHSPETAKAAMKQLIRDANLTVVTGEVQCGDLLVFCTRSGGPAHLGIVGNRTNTFWHSSSKGFTLSGWACPIGQQLLRCFRHGN